MRGQSIEAGISAVATVHYRAGYSPLLRVVYDGNIYGIVHVKRVDGGRRYIELFLKSLDIADRIVLGATADSTLLTADTTLTTADAEAS